MSAVYSAVVGSHLTGTSTESSDIDLVVVVNENQLIETQAQSNGLDVSVIGLELFKKRVAKGSPRYLDALFSTKVLWSDTEHIDHDALVTTIDLNEARRTFRNTILGYLGEGSNKSIHRSIVLTFAMDELMCRGKYCPELTEHQKTVMEHVAHSHTDVELVDFLLGKG